MLEAEFTTVPPSTDLRKLNLEFRAQNSRNALHTLAALRVDKLLGTDKDKCQREAIDILKEPGATLDDAQLVRDALQEWGAELGPFKSVARDRWPEASAFT